MCTLLLFSINLTQTDRMQVFPHCLIPSKFKFRNFIYCSSEIWRVKSDLECICTAKKEEVTINISCEFVCCNVVKNTGKIKIY